MPLDWLPALFMEPIGEGFVIVCEQLADPEWRSGADILYNAVADPAVRQPSFRILLCRFLGFLRIQPDRTDGLPVARFA